MPTDLPPEPEPTPGRPSGRRANTARSVSGDDGAYRIATVVGIPVRLHWSFLMLLVWLALSSFSHDASPRAGQSRSGDLIFVIGLFACVALHEFGHALTALRYGIRTRDIVLYPIGGVSNLERLPRAPEELWISLAGPAVNFAIAAIFYGCLHVIRLPVGPVSRVLSDLMIANVFLVAFNMLPAFPMDGGRVLRAMIARWTNEAQATGIAARVGQIMAILIGVVGALNLSSGGLMLIVIAIVIYAGAGREAVAYQTRFLSEGHRVREAMLREFNTLSVGDTLSQAADALLAGSQHDFPVLVGGDVAGVLSRTALLRGITEHGLDSYVAGVMERDFARVRPDDELESILERMPALQRGPILVMEGESDDCGGLLGMVTQENLVEFLMLAQLRKRDGQRV